MAAAATPDKPHSLDIGVERVARVYAQAIIEAANVKNCRGEVIEELESFVRDVLPQVPRAREVFDSPRVSVAEKDALIDRIAHGRMLPTTVHALHVLARHGRLGIVAEVAAAARRLAEDGWPRKWRAGSRRPSPPPSRWPTTSNAESWPTSSRLSASRSPLLSPSIPT